MEQKEKRQEPANMPPKDIRLRKEVKAKVNVDMKDFVKSQAEEFGKSEATIVRFSIDAIRGIFPPDFFPTKEELDETREDVLKLADTLAYIRRTVKSVGLLQNQIAKAIHQGKADVLLQQKYSSLLEETHQLMVACQDIYYLLEPNMELIFEKRPEWL